MNMIQYTANSRKSAFPKSPCGGFSGLYFSSPLGRLGGAFLLFFLLSAGVQAQEIPSQTQGIEKSAAVGVEYRVKAGIALGGTSPLPLPAEIRKINSFNPGLNLSLEGEVLKLFNERWGISTGLRLETRGMETDADVKGYQMTFQEDDGQEVSGYFWGSVKTDINNAFLTLPVLAVWKPAKRWGVKLGAYGSYAVKRSFSGLAYDGYFREGDPRGTYAEIDIPYNFSNNVCKWYWGWQVGGEFRAFPHLIAGVDVSWGMNSIFNKEFETIAFKMFPIYGTLSFGYTF